MQYMVSDGETFFHDERRNTISTIEVIDPDALGFKITNKDPDGRYVIEKQIIGDPHLNCLLMHTKFTVAPEWQGRLASVRHLRAAPEHRRLAQQRRSDASQRPAFPDRHTATTFTWRWERDSGFVQALLRIRGRQRWLDRPGAQLQDGLGVRLARPTATSR